MKKNKTPTTLMVCLLAGLTLLCSCAPLPNDVSGDISEANERFMAAFNNGDADLVADNYTDDGKLLPPNGDEVVGKENISGFWQGAMDMGISRAELVTIEANAYGNTAVEEGRYTLYTADDSEVDHGKYIVIWFKDKGMWKLQKDIWNTSNPPATARAAENDTVWVVWNKIKPDKVEQFKKFNFDILEPAAAEYYPDMRNTVRTLRPVEANDDGTWTWVYLMDPANASGSYDMLLPLEAKYGKEKALEHLNMFTECLKGGQQHWVVTTQSAW